MRIGRAGQESIPESIPSILEKKIRIDSFSGNRFPRGIDSRIDSFDSDIDDSDSSQTRESILNRIESDDELNQEVSLRFYLRLESKPKAM